MVDENVKITVELKHKPTFQTGEVWYEGPSGYEIPQDIKNQQKGPRYNAGESKALQPEPKTWEDVKRWDTPFVELFPCGNR